MSTKPYPKSYFMKKYDWLPTECAPKGYLMTIVMADFEYPDGTQISVPSGAVISNGWGKRGSIQIIGETEKEIPSRLLIVFFSFIEDKFYAGVFDFEPSRIESIIETSPDGSDEGSKYLVVGACPGGGVSVWFRNELTCTEIGFFYAGEVDIHWKNIAPDTQLSRQQYIQEYLTNSHQTFTNEEFSIENNTWGNKYRDIFKWNLIILGTRTAKDISIASFNGEENYIAELDASSQLLFNVVPSSISFDWESDFNLFQFVVTFDEHEIFKIFKVLSTEQPALDIVFEVSSFTGNIDSYVKNETNFIRFKNNLVKLS